MNEPVNDVCILSRYLTSSKHFSANNNRVKKAAFDPNPYKELSVFRTEGLSYDEIKILGKNHISNNIYGTGDLNPKQYEECGLNVDYDNNPERHTTILNWPEERDKQMLITIELANMASLQLFDTPIKVENT